MKKLLALLLTLSLILCSFALAAHAEDGCVCGHTPIIHVCGLGAKIYNGEDLVFPPTKDTILKAVKNAVGAVSPLLTGSASMWQQEKLLKVAQTIFGDIGLDENGDPTSGIGIHFNYRPDTSCHKTGDMIDFDHDWRLDPFDNAALLHDFVEYVKETTGHDKVCLVGESMGTILVNTYLAVYGFDGIESVVWYNGAYNGVATCSDSFAHKNDFSADALATYLAEIGTNSGSQFLYDFLTALYDSGLFAEVFDSALSINDSLEEHGFITRFMTSSIGRFPGFWSLVSYENFDTAIEYIFNTPELKAEYATLIERVTRYHTEVSAKVDDIMAQADALTGKAAIVCGYGSHMPAVTADNDQQSDSVISTAAESNGATCAPLGTAFPADYAQAVNDGHDHISPDREIDASTGFLPEKTWYVKYASHSFFGSGFSKTIVNKILDEEDFNVFSDPEFPQFMVFDKESGSISPLTADNGAGAQMDKGFFNKILTVLLKVQAMLLKFVKMLVNIGK
ncbi:MAG: hypothetical protein IJK02_07365 [Clostridia bacterium]|nr:hypothetical protein [Clostridia bacterium]